ncbi:hypothetical protein [Bacillus alkalisoli]|uniref:hypothetical protein n=1 Tax=Bacillus alkalisoli TaxID=2011008 RepID=UPI000C2394B1|nr:hypothetical protein [Bacillus alkalisoli]
MEPLQNLNPKEEKKLDKVMKKIGVKSPTEIISEEQLDKFIENLSKLPKESLDTIVANIPNFKEITIKYMDNLNLSFNKVMDDLMEEKKALYALLDKENITKEEKVFIFKEIKDIRRTILVKDTMYNVMNNKAFQFSMTVAITVVSAVASSKIKK